MINTLIMYTGAFVFFMLVVGVILTIREFNVLGENKLTPERKLANTVRSTQAPYGDN